MTVSAGAGGGGLVGVIGGGGGAVAGGPRTIAELPFTGATSLMLLIAVAVLAIITGVLLLGLARRYRGEPRSPQSGAVPPHRRAVA